ncbi:MAG: methyltransferase domain-containing protein [Candidatus Stahlbacteria bacterium]|nr:MAG: methyltransferase domain-containing protein [Candidatus Stahlbacteria bacterium]
MNLHSYLLDRFAPKNTFDYKSVNPPPPCCLLYRSYPFYVSHQQGVGQGAGAFLDLVYMITVLQEIPDRHRALLEAHRVLKPGGILAITEFFPDPDYPLKRTTVRLALSAGFTKDAVEGSFFNYTARFVKAA